MKKKLFAHSISTLLLFCFNLNIGETKAMKPVRLLVPPDSTYASSTMSSSNFSSIPNDYFEEDPDIAAPIFEEDPDIAAPIFEEDPDIAVPIQNLSVPPHPNLDQNVSTSLTQVNNGSVNRFVEDVLEPTFKSNTGFDATYRKLAGAAILYNTQMSVQSLNPNVLGDVNRLHKWYQDNWQSILPLFDSPLDQAIQHARIINNIVRPSPAEPLPDSPLNQSIQDLITITNNIASPSPAEPQNDVNERKRRIHKALAHIYGGSMPKKEVLLGVADECCSRCESGKLVLSRKAKRNYDELLLWFDDNWDKVKNIVESIVVVE